MTANELTPIISDLKDEFLSRKLNDWCDRTEEVLVDLNSSLAQVVIGVRRSGKSTLCQKIMRQNKVNCAYVNFDDERLSELSTGDLQTLLDVLYMTYGDFDYLILDEIQNIQGWPLFVNRLLRQNIHLLVTGSNAKLLSNDLMTHLTGRYCKIELYPFSFNEYCKIRGVDVISKSTKQKAFRKDSLLNYLNEGGLPELYRERNRRGYIQGLLEAMIHKDIAKRFGVRNVDVLQKEATYLIDNFAQEFKARQISEILGVSDHTVTKYYNYLKQAFLILGIPRFSFKSKERVSNEKFYVVDTAFLSNRESTFSSQNLGWRLENVIYVELLRRMRPLYKDIFYFRSRDFEVDFIITDGGHVEQLIQVCFDVSSEKTMRRELNGLSKGSVKFKCDKLTLITMHENGTVKTKEGKTVDIIDATDWLLTN